MSEEAPSVQEHVVAKLSEIPPGGAKMVEIRNIPIGVYNVGGTFYALQNMCPHQFGPLCNGRIGGAMACNEGTEWRTEWGRSGEILICPWHGLEFELKTGQCLAPKKYRARVFPVRVVEGEVRVALGRAPRADA